MLTTRRQHQRGATGVLALALLLLAGCPTPPPKTPRRSTPTPPERRDPLQLDLGRAGGPTGLMVVRSGEIWDVRRGRRISLKLLGQTLARTRVVFLGERHDHQTHHRVQAAVIRQLVTAPGPLAVGLEMLHRGHASAALERWRTGQLTEAELIKQIDWRKQWNMDFRYYRPIFSAARRHRLAVHGLNVPLRTARAVGRRGLSALTPETRATLPKLHLAAPRHKQLFRALLGLPPRARHARPTPPRGHHPHAGFLDRLFAAQVLRDEVMATEIVRLLERAGPKGRMAVAVGNGHLYYHTGVNLRLRRLRPRWSQATVICVSAGRTGLRVSRGLGDFLIGTPRHGPKQRYPRPRRPN